MEIHDKYRALLGKIGFLACRQALYDSAAPIFDGLQASAPERTGPVLGQSMVLMNQGKFDECIKKIEEEAFAIDKEDVHARVYLGLAYHMKEETGKAREILEPLLEVDNAAVAGIAQELLAETKTA